MSQVDLKRAFNKLKHDLEPWRNLIVTMSSVLTWQKNYYPGVIFAVISLFYLLLWLMDLSVITMISLAGLIVITFDFVYPSVSRFLFSPDNWSGEQEAQFENACTQLCSVRKMFGDWYEYLFTTKERKSTVFVIIVSISLLALAWIGAIMNNLVLMYMITLMTAMYPGAQEKCVFNAVKDKFGCVVNSKIQQLREKAKKGE